MQKEDPSPNIKPLLFELVCLRGSAHYHLNDLQQALQDGIKATTINSEEVKVRWMDKVRHSPDEGSMFAAMLPFSVTYIKNCCIAFSHFLLLLSQGYALLVSCYKELQRHSELLSALNECLIRGRGNSEEQWTFLKEAIKVAVDLPGKCILAK